MMRPKDQARALKYRRLALVERDQRTAALLRQLADEAEKGLLCTPDWKRSDNEVDPDAPKPIR